jgi:Fe-Mn family superoxide dismutase
MFTLPQLPYPIDALEPHISAETLEFHHGRHHKAYVDRLNALVKDSDLASMSLEQLITASGRQIVRNSSDIFNNAAQVWNHGFFWKCLTPDPTPPRGVLRRALESRFGSVDALQTQFKSAALATFGSGWVWLVKGDDEAIEIVSTSNAGNPLLNGKRPLLTCDVWEHAYYIDYRNARAEYVDAFWQIVNWDFVLDIFEREAPALSVA